VLRRLGRLPLGWRERFGPMPPGEALALASTTWLLADLLDGSLNASHSGLPGARPADRPSWSSSVVGQETRRQIDRGQGRIRAGIRLAAKLAQLCSIGDPRSWWVASRTMVR
jgi:hypothetical protein